MTNLIKTVYIAGKVTGCDIIKTRKKFGMAENILFRKGYHVINPLKLAPPESTWREAMQICINHLFSADYIYLLPDWKDSKGAKVEHFLAGKLGIEVLKVKELEVV